MTEQSKRRVVGGVVLLLVVVTLLPFLLRDEGDLDQFYVIPPSPEFSRLEVQKLERPAGVEEVEQKLAEEEENRLREEERQKRREEAAAAKEEQKLAEEEENRLREEERQKRREEAAAAKEEQRQIRDSLDEIVFNEQGVPLRWVVQAGSYVNDANAKRFSQRLIKDDFPTVTRKDTNSNQQVLYVVYVGPLLSRSKAVEYKNRLDKTYNIESRIRTWN